MSGFSRSLNLLFPPFAARVQAGLAAAQKAGHDAYLFEGHRGLIRQADLYASGRTKPGPIVTRAKPGESWHWFGLAVDLAFGGPGKWHWKGDFEALAPFMRAVGLEWLAPFELAHWQWADLPPIAEARALVQKDGLLSLWQQIESQTKVS